MLKTQGARELDPIEQRECLYLYLPSIGLDGAYTSKDQIPVVVHRETIISRGRGKFQPLITGGPNHLIEATAHDDDAAVAYIWERVVDMRFDLGRGKAGMAEDQERCHS